MFKAFPCLQRILQTLAVAALLLCGYSGLAAQGLPVAPSPAPAAASKPATPLATPPLPQAIPVHDIAHQAEASQATLREIERRELVADAIAAAVATIPRLERETSSRLQALRNLSGAQFNLETIQSMDLALRDIDLEAAPVRRELTRAASQTEQDLKELERLAATWSATLKAAAAAAAPPDLVERAEEMIDAVATVRKAVLRDRTTVLALQVRATDIGTRLGQVRELLAATSKDAVTRLFYRDGPPVWSEQFWRAPARGISNEARRHIGTQAAAWYAYLASQADSFALHGLFFVLLTVCLFAARGKVDALCRSDDALCSRRKIFDMPVVAAMLLAMLFSPLFYPDAPRPVWLMIGVLSTVPLAVFARRVIDSAIYPLVLWAVAFYLVDNLRALFAPLPGVYRALILLEALGLLLVILVSLRRRAAATRARSEERQRIALAVENISWAVLLLAAVILVAGATGYARLADFLLRGVVASAYAGAILYALTRVLEGAVLAALHVPPLDYLAGVRQHRTTIAARVDRWLKWLALGYWLVLTLQAPGLLQQAIGSIKSFWQISFEIGNLKVSVSGVLIFILILWATYQLSRLLRFLLEEEIFSRVRLDRGLPHAVSTTVHYAVLVTGLVLALTAIGVDMTRFTIVAGALTVGIGFGLQNIVNNFVSGLIILFERPINIGDTIQIDDIVGRVQHIGIRATVIQSTAGAEVIIPNGKLIADKVTNWTLSNQLRQVAVPVITKPDINVEQLKATLRETARQHRQVMQTPEPEVLFIKRGIDAFEFELRIWTGDLDGWLKVKSDLITRINEALETREISAEAAPPPAPPQA